MPGMSVAVGIIANPESGKDVRRIVTEASFVTTQEKLQHLKRILVGLGAAGPIEVLLARDAERLPERALESLPERSRPAIKMRPVVYPLSGTPADTEVGTRALGKAGAGFVIVLGGDGTNRLVHKAAPKMPLLPFSTGTNNAFPYWMEGTSLGAAAAVAAHRLRLTRPFARRLCRLRVNTPASQEIALIDVAVLEPGGQVKTVSNGKTLRELFLTRGEPWAVGLSSVLGWWDPLPARSGGGRRVLLDPGGPSNIRVPIGPGRIEPLSVRGVQALAPGEPVILAGPAVIALDGEPQLILGNGEKGSVTLEEGPRVLDPNALLEWGAREGLFRGGG